MAIGLAKSAGVCGACKCIGGRWWVGRRPSQLGRDARWEMVKSETCDDSTTKEKTKRKGGWMMDGGNGESSRRGPPIARDRDRE